MKVHDTLNHPQAQITHLLPAAYYIHILHLSASKNNTKIHICHKHEQSKLHADRMNANKTRELVLRGTSMKTAL